MSKKNEGGIYQISEELRRESRSIYNRLKSIEDDANFIEDISKELFKEYPIIANERCGVWYVKPQIAHAQTVYFKSTDGHHGKWSFNLRRANTHLFDILAINKGCIIVDSTRSGKRMPDSFSRTIPIWCSVWNMAIRNITMSNNYDQWDSSVHTPTNIVSESERLQIEKLIPQFVNILLASDIDVKWAATRLLRPLRPIWITRDQHLTIPPDFTNVEFTPIICLCASIAGLDAANSMPFGYVQGAADDHELWANGLTPHLFWKHRLQLLADRDYCDERVEKLIAREASAKSTLNYMSDGGFAFVRNTGLAVGGRTSGRPPECWSQFDAIINCGAPEYESNKDPALAARYLFLSIPEGKRGQIALGKSIPCALAFVYAYVQRGARVLVHCSQGMDRSVGIALAVLTQYFDTNGKFKENSASEITKLSIQNKLLWITTSRAKANPSRVTLKQVNRHFLDYL
ncbi:initiator tRNA phosphoribosyl transferase [Coemansia reversa NRRL 1564]|uniref:Initiator tRNA phosphoribosyl transferase n=1 Tax=Coemansia reversa (strain ATCC 12441 / NRRL 1564) TaxID=763665 RepID=A0A2G5BDT7_COERN|nr:initiator tRNA phosphoribosyl transferase [Coemansia reversa NRRL 1564]|eukprot:PIA17179.1 initiator tRNA phosphoribosyl transferase [Coemansia reversa NRRL 1564]